MPNRLIKSRVRTSTMQLADCLSALFALELLAPSRELYLISPWISNVRLVSNRFGQFRAVTSELNKRELGLADLLIALWERGTQVRVIYFPDQPGTEEFLRRLPGNAREGIQRRPSSRLHEKGLITEQFYLRGSMNFTHSGVNLNDESVELTTEPESVALALAEARRDWERLEKAITSGHL